jgi:bacillolysin
MMRTLRLAVPVVAISLILVPFGVRSHALGNARLTAMATAGRTVENWDRTTTDMVRSGDLRLTKVADDTLIAGHTHERFDQYYKGVRVFGGSTVRQMAAGQAVSVFGQLYTDISLDPTARLSQDDAKTTVQRLVPESTSDEPELVVLPAGDSYALAYRVRVKTSTTRTIYFVNAQSGDIAWQYPDLQSDSAIGLGTGVLGDRQKVSANSLGGGFVAEDLLRPPDIETFDMKGNVSRVLGFLNGVTSLGAADLASSSTNTWTDGPDVDAHVYAGFTYDYYFKRFGRHGLDNRDIPVTVLTHPVRRSDLTTASSDIVGLFYLNAFYAGDGVVVYGEGLPSNFVLSGTRQTVDYFAGGLDIVAHELSHGVTEFTSGLIYQDESGALNEAFSDVMGISTKFFFLPVGTGINQANYGLGSDVIRPGGLRSFDNPGVFGDPDHYSKRLITTDDNGGLHTNCTIVDHAFYLAIEGGTNRTSGLSVQGVGAANREQIEKVFYRGFTLMLTPNATFSMARAATIQSARDLYGAGSAAERAVTQAWTAVGVN